jgi:hypothetical protein
MKIECKTLFDCTATGVTGHYRPSQIPFTDRAGILVQDQEEWVISRNKQRNWETIVQIISLRSNPEDIKAPVCKDGTWSFQFVVMASDVFSNGTTNQFAALYQDCQGVPMVVDLDEQSGVEHTLCATGAKQNIWFETINS